MPRTPNTFSVLSSFMKFFRRKEQPKIEFEYVNGPYDGVTHMDKNYIFFAKESQIPLEMYCNYISTYKTGLYAYYRGYYVSPNKVVYKFVDYRKGPEQ